MPNLKTFTQNELRKNCRIFGKEIPQPLQESFNITLASVFNIFKSTTKQINTHTPCVSRYAVGVLFPSTRGETRRNCKCHKHAAVPPVRAAAFPRVLTVRPHEDFSAVRSFVARKKKKKTRVQQHVLVGSYDWS